MEQKKNSLKQSAENNGSGQLSLQLTNKAEERLDIPTMETWLWDAACKIRGATDAPKFKDFIEPKSDRPHPAKHPKSQRNPQASNIYQHT